MVFYDDEACGFSKNLCSALLVFLLTNCICVECRCRFKKTVAASGALALAFQATDAILSCNILVNQVALYENALRAIAKNARHCFPPSREQSKRRGLELLWPPKSSRFSHFSGLKGQSLRLTSQLLRATIYLYKELLFFA